MCFFFIPRHSASAILFCRSFHHHQNFCSSAPSQPVALPLAFNVCPEKFGPEKTNPLVIVHGLLGHKKNWRGIASALQKELQNRVFVVDMTVSAMPCFFCASSRSASEKCLGIASLCREFVASAKRNHGESPHCSDSTYPSMALDLRQFIEQKANLIEKLVFEDIAPQRNSHHSSLTEFRAYIDALRSVDLRLSRREISKALEPSIREESVRAFMLTNLCQDRPGLNKWRCNLDALSDNLEYIVAHTLAVPDKKISIPTLFLYGANSTYCSEFDIRPLRQMFFSYAKFEEVPEAGHIIHSEQPQRFIESVTRFLKRGYISYNDNE
uniref:AB hydrolase-1 domain-containing protein n=1 Tax=Globodera rostochiensis TaxID=31243 RepID=A0A914HZ74_GLORO